MFLVVGTTTVDLYVSGLEHTVSLGEDEFTEDNFSFCDEPLTLALGGNGGSAYVLAKLGAHTTLCSAVGEDRFGDMACEWLRQAGVQLSSLKRSATEATSTTTILSDERRNRFSAHYPGATDEFDMASIPEAIFQQAEVVLITGYPLLVGWRPRGVRNALRIAHESGALTALDIGPAIGDPLRLSELKPVFSHLDYLFCNSGELAACTNTTQLEDGIKQAAEAGAPCLVVKCGAQGAVVTQRNGSTMSIPGFDVNAEFTVGAGDAFNAGFLFKVFQGEDLERATRFANAVAAHVVMNARGVLGSPDVDEAEQLLDQKTKM